MHLRYANVQIGSILKYHLQSLTSRSSEVFNLYFEIGSGYTLKMLIGIIQFENAVLLMHRNQKWNNDVIPIRITISFLVNVFTFLMLKLEVMLFFSQPFLEIFLFIYLKTSTPPNFFHPNQFTGWAFPITYNLFENIFTFYLKRQKHKWI